MSRISLLLFLYLIIRLPGYGQDISKLYENVLPSVVTIKIEEKEVVTDYTTRTKALVTTEGLGAGVVVSEKGEIMTAAHVVQTAEKVVVQFHNGDEVPAKVVTANVDADVALIKLVWLPKDMQVARLADSDKVRIGEQVFVVGAPLGLSNSLSVGHISGRMKDDELSDGFSKIEFFQTDAAINHGNSGGPMFNMRGEVIGIVSFILSQSGGFEGIGFAVTANVARAELLGKQPFWFGVSFVPLAGELAGLFNLPQPMGLLIQKVATNSPADLAGIRGGIYQMTIEDKELLGGGDIILAIDSFVIKPDLNTAALRSHLANIKPGEEVKIKLLRQGEIKQVVIIAPEK